MRALRKHLGYTQQELSDELGTRQQTVSEWETGLYQPRGASAKLLSLVAERAGFHYGEQPAPRAVASAAAPASAPAEPEVDTQAAAAAGPQSGDEAAGHRAV